MPERAMRATVAINPVDSVTAGSTRCFHVPTPEVGNSRSCTENIRISTIARKNCGVTIPSTAPIVAAVSIIVPRRSAATIPSGSPSAIPNTSAAAPSRRLFGSRSKITVVVGTPYRNE